MLILVYSVGLMTVTMLDELDKSKVVKIYLSTHIRSHTRIDQDTLK